ncbi:hypothetical protein [Paenibacillus faecalis]|uniref:hypothetical protein n=1 Tax=Paenibacillus faecalis TaxID=2079532 RepID=UPI001F3BFE94|nr:hypothetical protein [Paenibacillus faecalis]
MIHQKSNKSVTATHDFLNFDDKQEIQNEIPSYLSQLDVRLWYVESSLIGFSAIHQNHLEMFFYILMKLAKDMENKSFNY